MFKSAVNITANSDTTLKTSDNINNGMYGEVISNKVGSTLNSKNNNMVVMIDRVRNP